MKTPRRALLCTLVLSAASVARAADPILIPFPDQNAAMDFKQQQRGSDWIVLKVKHPALGPVILAPADEYFVVSARARFGFASVMRVSDKPIPGALSGEPVSVFSLDGKKQLPLMWLPSQSPELINNERALWPADSRASFDDRFNGAPAQWWTNPKALVGQTVAPQNDPFKLFTNNNWSRTPPPTVYPETSRYSYDPSSKKLFNGAGKAVAYERMPGETLGQNGFFFAPVVISRDADMRGLKVLHANGTPADTKKGATTRPKVVSGEHHHHVGRGGEWNDAITPISAWFAVQTTQMPVPMPLNVPALTFYCYHADMNGDTSLAAHLKRFPTLKAECVDWMIPAGDATQEAGGKKYKVRNNHFKFDVGFVDGKLVSLGGILSIVVSEKPLSSAAIGGEKFVKVSLDKPAVAGAVALSEKEKVWLDKTQQGAYKLAYADAQAKPDAVKALADATRGQVVENLAPNAAAASAYGTAAKDAKATAAAIDASLPPKVWGGDVNAVVELSGENLEIQLSKADWDLLNKEPLTAELKAARDAYVDKRKTNADGDVRKGPTMAHVFDLIAYDPIVLHRTAEAARAALKALPPPPVVAAKDEKDLTDDELKKLTPEEQKLYKNLRDRARAKTGTAEEKRQLYEMNADLRAKAAARSTYAAPGNLAAFNKLGDWAKKKFCDELPPIVAASGDTKDNSFDKVGTTGSAVGEVADAAAKGDVNRSAEDKRWTNADAQDACTKFKGDNAVKPGSGPASKKPVAKVVPDPTAKDVGDTENAKPKPNSWTTGPLIRSAIVGGLAGLVIGSLFGPIGLIAGPLIGAALLYGMDKYAASKKKDDE